jgi:hypothetical protein
MNRSAQSIIWVLLGMGRSSKLYKKIRGINKDSPKQQFVTTSSGYPWQVAPQQSPLPFHRMVLNNICKFNVNSFLNKD